MLFYISIYQCIYLSETFLFPEKYPLTLQNALQSFLQQ